MDKKIYQIVLIRHGKTRGNTEKLYSGSTDIPLLDIGRQDIMECKEKGYYPPLDGYHLYTTGLKRTVETKDIVYPDAPFTALDELNEMDFGDFEMRTHADMQHLPDYQAFIQDITGKVRCPNGESLQDFQQRCTQGFLQIMKKRENAILFAHSGTIARVMMNLFPREKSHFIYWQPNNGRGFIVKFEDDTAITYTPLSDDTYLNKEENNL